MVSVSSVGVWQCSLLVNFPLHCQMVWRYWSVGVPHLRAKETATFLAYQLDRKYALAAVGSAEGFFPS